MRGGPGSKSVKREQAARDAFGLPAYVLMGKEGRGGESNRFLLDRFSGGSYFDRLLNLVESEGRVLKSGVTAWSVVGSPVIETEAALRPASFVARLAGGGDWLPAEPMKHGFQQAFYAGVLHCLKQNFTLCRKGEKG